MQAKSLGISEQYGPQRLVCMTHWHVEYALALTNHTPAMGQIATLNMVKTNKENCIPDWLTPGSTRAMPVTEDQGHMVYDGNLASGGSDNGPHQPPETREAQTPSNTKTRKKWSTSQNREVMVCYYKSEPEKQGYRKRFHSIWHE